jgi:hypothetical protein
MHQDDSAIEQSRRALALAPFRDPYATLILISASALSGRRQQAGRGAQGLSRRRLVEERNHGPVPDAATIDGKQSGLDNLQRKIGREPPEGRTSRVIKRFKTSGLKFVVSPK